MGKIGLETPSGNVIGICRNRVSDSIYHRFPPHGREPDFNYKILNMTTPVYLVSFVFGELLVLIGCVLALKWNLKEVVKMSYTYSYKYYGLWWGVTCFWFIPVPILLYCDVLVAMSGYPEYGTSVQYPASTILLVVIIVPGLIIAGYFTCKTKPPAVPYILMIPVTALLCCCNTQRAKLLVFGIALWINVVAAKLIMLLAILVILAILAEPFAVITNTLVLILVAFCITNILALLFTIFAYLFTPKHKRPQGQGKTMLHAVVLIPLLAMIICLCLSIFSIGYLTNRDTKQGNTISLLSSVALPVILGAVTFGLRRLITKWLNKAPNNGKMLEEGPIGTIEVNEIVDVLADSY